jgi:hypothetical protein
MYRILCIIALFVSSHLYGQTINYLVQINQSFNGKNEFIISANDTLFFKEEIITELSTNGAIDYEIRGAPIILGKARYSEFIADKEKLISYYHNFVLQEVSPDYTVIHYEIESESGEEKTVTFYYYETYFSGTLPDKLMLSTGYYNTTILSNGLTIKSIPILIFNNSIIKLSN